jgi:serine/threonine protein kinase
MAAAVSSVEILCNRLTRSRLLKAQHIRSIYQQWRRLVPRGSAGDVERFVKWLVSSHWLTAYQTQQLILGQSDHFFLNHYRLLDLIGKGRMAGIFKAAHVSGHIVAIKIMPHAKARDTTLMARFRREAKMAVRLKNENIVRSFHLGVSGTRHYLVMEYLEGETLEDILKRRKKMPYTEAARLIHQALLGLQHIHEEGMVHRDMKPGNLMLTPLRPPGAPDNTLQATVKIMDIGLGRILFDENMTADMEENRLTVEGTMLGTLDYMAPEQAKDAHNVDVRADVYSLGAVFYHILCGQPPFADTNPVMQMIRLATEEPRPIRELEPSVPDGLQTVLHTMLAKDPKKRYATPAKAAHAVQSFLAAQRELLPESKSLGEFYLKWVDSQPLEEVNDAPITADRWYYFHEGKICGPVSSAQLDQHAATGKVDPDDMLWMEGDDPVLGIHARAAIDFASVARRQTATAADTGFDPHTGRIHDAEKFRRWQKEQRGKQPPPVFSGGSLQEIFFKARNDLSTWLDLEKNRQLIISGDMEAIRQDPMIQKFMLAHQRYGQELLHKLWHHLEFMLENRRKYFYALAR